MNINFTCPYCNQATTITSPNSDSKFIYIDTLKSEYETIGLGFEAIACPNVDCKKLSLDVRLSNGSHVNPRDGRRYFSERDSIKNWKLLPQSSAKSQPDYIPEAIREDYYEACAVLPYSAKASATLSRRCLQGIVRDYWDIPTGTRGNLGAELSFIKDKVNSSTWDGIQAIRSVGDIGAHMEKDVNFVVDVEPEEASLLIELIETLFKDWYVESHQRKERSDRVKALVDKKLTEKKKAKTAAKAATVNTKKLE